MNSYYLGIPCIQFSWSDFLHRLSLRQFFYVSSEVNTLSLYFDRKRRKKIQVRIIETRHPEESSSDSEDEQIPPPPPPPGSPKLYQTAEFVAKFAYKELQVAS